MARILLGSVFGLERASIVAACEGDRSAGIKQEARHGDRILHDLVSERVSPSERSHYEANSMLSWFLREGSNLSTYASMQGHSDHSFGTVFEAMLYRAPEGLRREAVAKYMGWVNERWQSHPIRGRRPQLRTVGHDRALSEHGLSAAEGAAVLAELEAWEEAWAWDNDEGQLSEAELREVLSEMHTAFSATRLGDVQEELALRAAIAASAAEAKERDDDYVGHEGLQRCAMKASKMQSTSTAVLGPCFTQEHIGYFVNIVDGKVFIKRKNKGKMKSHPVTWNGAPPPTLAGVIQRVFEHSVQLQGGKAFPNPAKADQHTAKWERFKLHQAGMLTAKQIRRTEAAAMTVASVPVAAEGFTLNPLAQPFQSGLSSRDMRLPLSGERLGDVQTNT